jgi:hypothetical protein
MNPEITRPSAAVRLLGALFGLPFLIAGLAMMGTGACTGVQLAVANATWAQIPAKVVSSGVTTRQSTKGRTIYTANVLYVYDLHGTRYSSSRINADPVNSGVSGTDSSASDWVASHPVGCLPTAYVDPSNPAESALDVSLSFLTLLLMLFPIPHTLIGLAAVSYAVLGGRKIPKFRAYLILVLIAWGLIAAGLVYGAHSINWATATTLAVYFGLLTLVVKSGIGRRRSE